MLFESGGMGDAKDIRIIDIRSDYRTWYSGFWCKRQKDGIFGVNKWTLIRIKKIEWARSCGSLRSITAAR